MEWSELCRLPRLDVVRVDTSCPRLTGPVAAAGPHWTGDAGHRRLAGMTSTGCGSETGTVSGIHSARDARAEADSLPCETWNTSYRFTVSTICDVLTRTICNHSAVSATE